MSAFGFTDDPPAPESTTNAFDFTDETQGFDFGSAESSNESAFSFTNDPVDNNESAFDFGSAAETNESEKNELAFSFGQQQPEEQPKEEYHVQKRVVKKNTPRVIGQGKKNKAKVNRFAKKTDLSSNKTKIFPSKPKKEEQQIAEKHEEKEEPTSPVTKAESNDAIDSSQPITQKVETSEQLKEEINPFTVNNNEKQISEPLNLVSNENEEKNETFDFISHQEEKTVEINTAQSSSQGPVVESEKKQEFSDLNSECNSFVSKLVACKKTLQISLESVKKDKSTLSDLEKRQVEALNTEQYELADQLNTSILKIKSIITENQSNFLKSIAEAMTISNEAPGHLLSHAASSQIELPQLRVRKSALDKRIITLVDEQENDKQTIEAEKKKNESIIEEIEKPIKEHKANHEALEKELQQRIDEAKKPFVEKLEQYQSETDEHNKIIQDLQAQIRQHQKSIKELNNKIMDTKKQIKTTEAQFNKDKISLQDDSYKIKIESDKFLQKVKEIEAPYQSLVDAVEKRDSEIKGITTAVDKITKQIEDGEKDASECESAAKIINKLCQDHFQYSDKRNDLKKTYDDALRIESDNENKRNQINEDTVILRGKLQSASEQLMAAKSSLPQLETSKKAAVASKNFRGAQQISKQIASMNEQITANESFVQQTSELIEKMETEAVGISTQISKAQADLEESKIALLQLDFEFFNNSVEVLESLFKISPFGEKLLHPLLNMFQYAKDNTEVPKIMSKEEMESEIKKLTQIVEDAISKDDFDTAAQIQEQIDTLTAKIAKLSN